MHTYFTAIFIRISLFCLQVLVYETNNVDADRAFAAVQSYLERTKIAGLSLGNVTRVTLDSTQKYLTVDDGKNMTFLSSCS
jgi:hypothetical protein